MKAIEHEVSTTPPLDKSAVGDPQQTGLEIDPLSRMGPRVHLEPPARVGAGAVLEGPLWAGPGLRVHPNALVGGPAQHREGGSGVLELGEGVEVRECATIHRGSSVGSGVTRIGSRVMVMAYAHIGHDAQVGDDVVLANGAQVGGHVHIGEGAVLAARCAVHQFVRVGRGAMVAAGALVSGDVPPWTLVAGDRARIVGPNVVGLRALGDQASASRLRKAIRLLFPKVGESPVAPGELIGAMPVPEEAAADPALSDLIAFLEASSQRPLCGRPGRGG
ncbi:MAG TPA: acyl-[acyl-carrier-protein]--UDP-N-acetylglucosamine O-acyltransferase [Deltaproteobacteria bacterium]|nr:acyl-[acyl-carrier-protein]--UDP-N-acetylglucosamine O-acyltransferase [Deltaproteobacteria bacterium]HCP45980.1 acyl-[acyl-carrier-protein]--UDP-N-acetylglucosamine O-acyltransferase [Deltaproteobacteria bacterium]